MKRIGSRLKRANEILLAVSSFFARELDPATAVVVAFIDDHRERFGVEPICRVLTEHGVKIAPSSYYAFSSNWPPMTGRLLYHCPVSRSGASAVEPYLQGWL